MYYTFDEVYEARMTKREHIATPLTRRVYNEALMMRRVYNEARGTYDKACE